MKAVQASCNDTPTIRFNFLDIEECARKTGLKSVPSDAHSETLFLNLMRVDPPRIQFANDDQRHGHHLDQIRFALHAVGALALAGCLLYPGKVAVRRARSHPRDRSPRQREHASRANATPST